MRPIGVKKVFSENILCSVMVLLSVIITASTGKIVTFDTNRYSINVLLLCCVKHALSPYLFRQTE